tara:strand:+ start:100 stop:837 length:738 start_codon:yes stop_codon:yes gene_type:complete
MIDITNIYHRFLVKKADERRPNNKKFHASGSGSCYRKQFYSYYDYPIDKKDDKSLRILDLGTTVHERIQESVNWWSNNTDVRKAYIEDEIEIPFLNLVGKYDIGVIDDDQNIFYLWDIKTAAAYKWTTMFGRKDNRVAGSSDNYKLQLGTYALGIKQKYNPDTINMYLLWYNKNTSMMREQPIEPEWIDKAEEYWSNVNDILSTYGKDFEESEVLMPGISPGSPFADWECKYCQYNSICPTTIKK